MPKYKLATIFLLLTIIAVGVAVFDSRRRATLGLALCDKQIRSAVEEISDRIYQDGEEQLNQLNESQFDKLQNVRTSDPKKPFLFLKPRNLSWNEVDGFYRTSEVHLVCHLPMKFENGPAFNQRYYEFVQMKIDFYSSGFIFRNRVQAKIRVRGDAERNDEFLALITERLDNLNISYSIERPIQNEKE